MADTPIQPDNEFSSDMVKAVENIANNVKTGSSELTKSFDGLTKSIQTLQNSVIESINKLNITFKLVRNNNTTSSSNKTPKVSPEEKERLKAKKEEDKAIAKAAKDAQKQKEKEDKVVAKEAREAQKRKEKDEKSAAKASEKAIKDAQKQKEKQDKEAAKLAKDTQKALEKSAKEAQKNKEKEDKESAKIAKEAQKSAEKAAKDAQKASEKAAKDAQKKKEKEDKDAAKAAKDAQKASEKAAKDAQKQKEKDDKEAARAAKDAQKATDKAAKEAQRQKDKQDKDAAKAAKDAQKATEKAAKEAQKKKEKEDKEAAKAAKEAAKAADKAAKEAQEKAREEADAEEEKKQKELERKMLPVEALMSIGSSLSRFTSFLKPLFSGPIVSAGFKMMKSATKKADGGPIFEPKGTDTVPAMLTPGEFVVNKDATKKNKGLLQAINNGKANGGSVGYFSSGGGVSYLAAGGAAAGGAGAIMAGIGIAMNSITSAVQIATGAVQMFGAALAKANPAMMEQIGIIMNDLSGVIGRALIPVVQMVIPLFRQYADYVDAGMQALQPVIKLLVDTFATLFDPMLQLNMTILNIVAPVLTLVGGLLSGFATILDPLIQIVAETVESIQAFFTAILGPIPFMDILKVGFDALAQVLKMVQGVFSMLIASFQKTIGMLVSGLGAVLSKIPFMGAAGEAMKKAGEDLEGQAKNQFDKGMARVGEGANNLGKMIQDPKNYKLDDKTRFKAGEIIGKDKGIKPGSSVGAAVREVQSMSISSIGDDIRKSAMMAGMGQKSQEELLGGIEKNLEKDKLAAAVQQGVMAANNAVQKPVVFNQPPNMNAQNGGVNAVPA